MSKDTTDLRLKIEHYLVSTQQDGAGIAMGRRSADGSLYKSRIDEFTEAIMSEIDQLISNREKLLLDRLESKTEFLPKMTYYDGDMKVQTKAVPLEELQILRKELDGGQE